MNLFIDNKSGAPIYDQIYSQIKSQIISGELRENEELPSIRNSARDVQNRVVTNKRGYGALAGAGLIDALPAKGCFVAPKNVELLREENLKTIEDYMQKISRLAASCGLTRQDVIDMFCLMMEE